MKQSFQSRSKTGSPDTQPHRTQRSGAPSALPAPMPAMMNDSLQAQGLAQMKDELGKSPHVQGLMNLAAEINQSAFTPLPHGSGRDNVKQSEIGASGRARTIQMNRVDPLEDQETLTQTVESMRARAQGAAIDMLFDFEDLDEELEYFRATNEQEGGLERFGLMSLSAPPGINAGEQDQQARPAIDNSLWVEGLVADPGSGLGAELLQTAQGLAAERQRASVALAAYEYDPSDRGEDGNPYSIAKYYADRGFIYSGEAFEEVDDSDEEDPTSYFYPIYYRNVVL